MYSILYGVCRKTSHSYNVADFQGHNENRILTGNGLALPGILTGHLAGSPLRQCLVIATLGLAIKISILGM